VRRLDAALPLSKPYIFTHTGIQIQIRSIQRQSGDAVKQHKQIKDLKDQNPRDHISEAELIFTALAELSTRQIVESVEATGMDENAEAGKKGGGIAKKARRELEQKTGRSVVTGENFLPPAKTKNKLGDTANET
jgi:hypothetical protein